MIRYCTECGAAFKCSPSDKTVTCSPVCSSKRRSKLLTGKKRPGDVTAKIAAAAKSQDRSDILSRGTAAAQASPKAGRFTTNSSAKGWTLISPEGVMHKCTNLMQFIREHAADFGIAVDDDAAAKRIHSGFRVVKQKMKHGSGCTIYGWTLVEWDDRKNCEK